MGLLQCIPGFLKKNAGWIGTALSAIGLFGTAVLVAEEAPEVQKDIKDKLYWKIHRRVDELMDIQERNGKDPESWTDDELLYLYEQSTDETELTFIEKFNIAAPTYLPAFLVGSLTIGCILGTQIFNAKQQAAMAASYALLGQEYFQYRKAIKEEYGEEADKKALAVAKAETKKLREELEKLKNENGPFLYTIASLPGVVFESTPKDIYEALYHFNRNMNQGRGSLSNLYEMIGLPCTLFNDVDGWDNTSAGDYGWDTYENEITYGDPEGYFKIDKVGVKNGKPIFLIDFSIQPYKLGLDYGMSDCSVDHIYEWYCPEEATRIARAVSDGEVIRFDPPEHYILGF